MKFKTTSFVSNLKTDEAKVTINPDTEVSVIDVKLDEKFSNGVALLTELRGSDCTIRIWLDSSCVQRIKL